MKVFVIAEESLASCICLNVWIRNIAMKPEAYLSPLPLQDRARCGVCEFGSHCIKYEAVLFQEYEAVLFQEPRRLYHGLHQCCFTYMF